MNCEERSMDVNHGHNSELLTAAGIESAAHSGRQICPINCLPTSLPHGGVALLSLHVR